MDLTTRVMILEEENKKLKEVIRKLNQEILILKRDCLKEEIKYESEESTNIIRLGRNGKYYAKFVTTAEELVQLFNKLPEFFDRSYLMTLLTHEGHGRAGLKATYIIYFFADKGLIKITSMHPLKCKKVKEKIYINDIV